MADYVVGMTGASGAVYGARLLQALVAAGHRVHLVVSPAGETVVRQELGDGWQPPAGVRRYAPEEIGAPIASGSFPVRGMVVAPASMGLVSAVAHGASRNLLERAADVCLKEGRPLVLVPRETPLSTVHLRNLLHVAEAGARVVMAAPGFYHRPRTVADLVDFVVARVLSVLGEPQDLLPPWEGIGSGPH